MIRFSAQVASLGVAIALYSATSLAGQSSDAWSDAVAEAAPLYAVTPPRDFADVKLAIAAKIGSQSSVAVNPKNPNVFLAGYAAGGSCWVRTSTSAGQTWAAAKKLPMPPAVPCGYPALIWAPDGSRVYAAYGYYSGRYALTMVSSSTDKGLTWAPPKTAFSGYDFSLFSVKLATPLGGNDARWVYLLLDLLDSEAIQEVLFIRSADRGQNWESPLNIVGGHVRSYATSPSIAGGLGGEVLISYGYLDDHNMTDVTKDIQVHHSSDRGTTFQEHIVAVPNVLGDTAVGFGSRGTAHIVYNDDYGTPSTGISYVYSTNTPYNKWSAPILLHDDPSASHYYSAALTVSACGSGTSVLHAVWLDDRAGAGKYNVYYTRKVAKTGELWSSNLRLSGTALPPNIYGDGYGLKAAIAAGAGTAVGVWGQAGNYDSPLPAWASRIAPGVSCP